MKAILQAFVDVPEMEPQPLMKFPMELTLLELRALLTAGKIIQQHYPNQSGQNLAHAVECLKMTVHAMQSWEEEHK